MDLHRFPIRSPQDAVALAPPIHKDTNGVRLVPVIGRVVGDGQVELVGAAKVSARDGLAQP